MWSSVHVAQATSDHHSDPVQLFLLLDCSSVSSENRGPAH